uniref:CCHC-type domain-containing protein n=1 Tax=Oryzias sinensis TaxID=183150 RepID=A0A8C7X486_9TELE
MDAAGAEASRANASSQEWVIRHQEEQLNCLRRGMLEMADRQEKQLTAVCDRIDTLARQVQQPLTPQPLHPSSAASTPMVPVQTPAAPAVQLARPERFSGDSGDCRAFVTQCELHFELHAASFPTDRAKVAFIISHLTGRAGAWATAEWQRGGATCFSLSVFLDAFTQVFQHTKPGREAARALMRLTQGNRRVTDYAIEFRTLAAESGWNPAALVDAFLEGLSEVLKDNLAPLELPSSLEPLIALVIRIDNRLQDRRRGRRSNAPFSRGRTDDYDPPSSLPSSVASTDSPVAPLEEPMQLGRGRLSPSERIRRIAAGECLYCGQRGHFCKHCPNVPVRH